MSRWLPKDVSFLPLGKIDAEIAAIEAKPMFERTVIDAERLKDLHEARRRITGGRRGCW